MNERELSALKLKLEMSVIEEKTPDNKNPENHIIITDEEDLLSDDDDSYDSCDFSESLMLENALVLLPKDTKIKRLNSIQLRELIKRETKKKLMKTLSKKKLSKKLSKRLLKGAPPKVDERNSGSSNDSKVYKGTGKNKEINNNNNEKKKTNFNLEVKSCRGSCSSSNENDDAIIKLDTLDIDKLNNIDNIQYIDNNDDSNNKTILEYDITKKASSPIKSPKKGIIKKFSLNDSQSDRMRLDKLSVQEGGRGSGSLATTQATVPNTLESAGNIIQNVKDKKDCLIF